MKRWRMLLGAALFGSGACGGSASSPAPLPAPASRPVDGCADERRRAEDLTADGHIIRALVVLEVANQSCPDTARSRDANRALRAELATQTPALELVRAGMTRLADHDPSGAQREFDRALASWRRTTGRIERVVLLASQDRYSVTERFAILSAAATPDNRFVSVVVDPDRPGRMSHVVGFNDTKITEAGGLLLRSEPEIYLDHTGSVPFVLEPLRDRLFTRDGHHIVGIRGGQLVVVATATGQRIAEATLDDDFQLSPFQPLEVVGDRLLAFGYRPHATESLIAMSFPDLANRREVSGAHRAVSFDGAYAVVFEPTTTATTNLHTYDLRSGLLENTATCRSPPESARGSQIAISQDGATVATVMGEAEIELVDVAAHRTHSLRVPVGAGEGDLLAPRFTHDGRHLCVLRARARTRVLDLRTRRFLAPRWACAVDATRALAVEVPLTPGHELVATPWGGGLPVVAVALSEDGTVAAAIEAAPRHPNERWMLVFEPTGRRVRFRPRVDDDTEADWIQFQDDLVRVSLDKAYDVVTGAPRDASMKEARPPAFATTNVLPKEDAGWAAQIAASTVVWKSGSRFHAWRLPDTVTKVMSDAVCGVAVSGDGRFVAATPPCGGAGDARVWDMRDGRLVTKRAVPASGDIAAVSVSGRWLAFADGKVLQVLNAASGDLHRVELLRSIERLAISPDERDIAVQTRGDVSLRALDALADAKWTTPFGLGWTELKFAAYGTAVGAIHELVVVADGTSRAEVPGITINRGGSNSFMAFLGTPPAGLSAGVTIALTDSIASTQPSSWSLAGRLLLATTNGSSAPDGTVEVHDLATRLRRALLVPQPRGALAFLPGGYVEWLGDPAEPQGLICQAGAEVFPFAVCRERWTLSGGLARAWRGEDPSDGPR